jgi:Domain of unknown function (DUF222)
MFEDLSVRAVESELVELAGNLAAGTCRFLQLLAEFDERDGWAGPGLRSCAHWLNWRVGLSLRTARDHLRVAHALRGLPETSAAFAAGRVSFSKVRALTRIATPESERGLLSLALHGTASQVESAVAAARAGMDPRPATARRGMRWSRAGDGSLLVSLRIPAAEGAQLVAAVEALIAQDAEAAETAEDVKTAGNAADAETAEVAGDAEDVGDVGGVVEGGGGGGVVGVVEGGGGGSAEPRPDDSAPLRHRSRGRSRREKSEESGKRGVEQAPGPVVDPIAARRLDALLDLVTGRQPAPETTLVVHLRADADTDAADVDTTHADTTGLATAGVADAADLAPAGAGDVLRPVAWLEGGPVIHPTVAARLSCIAAVQALLTDRRGNPLYLGRRRRTVNRAQLRALRVRDQDRCVFPGCTSTRHLQAHHLRWWRHGGATDLDNLALVCTFHHTLVHEQGYQLVAEQDGRFTATCIDGTPIPRAGKPTHGYPEALRVVGIDDRTITPRWGGERLDRDQLLAWLLPTLRTTARAAA